MTRSAFGSKMKQWVPKKFFYDERNQLRESDLKIISYLEKLIDENALLKRIKQGKTHQMIKKK